MNTETIVRKAFDIVLKYKNEKNVSPKQVAAVFASENAISIELAQEIIKGALVAVGIIDAVNSNGKIQSIIKERHN